MSHLTRLSVAAASNGLQPGQILFSCLRGQFGSKVAFTSSIMRSAATIQS